MTPREELAQLERQGLLDPLAQPVAQDPLVRLAPRVPLALPVPLEPQERSLLLRAQMTVTFLDMYTPMLRQQL